MEDLIGILIFLFIIFSGAKKDRKRGMTKEPSRDAAQPAQENLLEVLLSEVKKAASDSWDEVEQPSASSKRAEKRPVFDSDESWERFDTLVDTRNNDTDEEYGSAEGYGTNEGYGIADDYGSAEGYQLVTGDSTNTAYNVQTSPLSEGPAGLQPNYVMKDTANPVPVVQSQVGYAGMNLREAIIWSEILQKPKALQRRGGVGVRTR